jgi:integrase
VHGFDVRTDSNFLLPLGAGQIKISTDNAVNGQGRKLARRRFQRGQLLLLGTENERRWYGRWYDDVIENGASRRIRRQEFLGTLKDYPTRKLALRELEAKLSLVNSPTYKARPTATFTEFADRWDAAILPQLKPSTAVNYRSHLSKHLKPYFGEHQLKDIGPEMVQRFISGLKVHPSTQRRVFATIQSLWRSAKAWGYVSHSISEGVLLPAKIKAKRPFFSMDDMRRIITKAAEPYKTCFWIAAETGSRAGEICGLRWESIDLENRLLTVERAAWEGTLQEPKTTGSVRQFCISSELTEHLKAFREGWKPNSLGVLFISKKGRPWRAIKPLKYLKAVLAELEIAPAGMHAFRHAQATVALREGVPLKTVQARLGHDSADLTAKVYAHAVGEDDRNFAGWLGKRLNPEEKVSNLDPSGPKVVVMKKRSA